VVVPANSSAIFMIVSWHPLIRIQSYFKDTKYALQILIIKGHSFSWHSEILLPHVRRILIYTVLVHQEGLRVQVQSTAVLVWLAEFCCSPSTIFPAMVSIINR
jgi:hypothetical protein